MALTNKLNQLVPNSSILAISNLNYANKSWLLVLKFIANPSRILTSSQICKKLMKIRDGEEELEQINQIQYFSISSYCYMLSIYFINYLIIHHENTYEIFVFAFCFFENCDRIALTEHFSHFSFDLFSQIY